MYVVFFCLSCPLYVYVQPLQLLVYSGVRLCNVLCFKSIILLKYRSLCIMHHLSLTRSTYFYCIAQALARVLRASTGRTVRCRYRWRRAFRVTKVSTQLNLHKLATRAPGLKGTHLLSRSESFYNRIFVSIIMLFSRRYDVDYK